MVKSTLIPNKEGNLLDYDTWNAHTSEEHKWELWDGIPFGPNILQRDKLAICLLYSMGLDHFTKILPSQCKNDLFQLLKKEQG